MSRKFDIESIAKAIEADAGEALPDLRQALEEAQSLTGRVTSPEQILVRQAREKAGLTQAAFAERIATPVTTTGHPLCRLAQPRMSVIDRTPQTPQKLTMPIISRFFGIIIRMFFNEHAPPHFHAEYGEYRATIDIRSLSIIDGKLPRRATELVLDWAELHRNELLQDWELCQRHQQPVEIQPLE